MSFCLRKKWFSRTTVCYAACFALIALVPGCSPSNKGYVSGSVTFDGQPLRSEPQVRAMIAFHPTTGGTVATGTLNADGEYQIVSGSQSGIEPGSYLVTVSASRKIPAKREGDAPSRQQITPAKYATTKSSPFKAQVELGSNIFDFELDTSAEK